MVLQRNKTIPVWGWANSKEKISVQLHNQIKNVVADNNGKWRINLAAEKAGGPYKLVVKGRNTISISNVLIGDVWICSGQSNMEMKVADLASTNNYAAEIVSAKYPAIRQFIVKKPAATSPQNDVDASNWEICSPATVNNFSAVAYFFARRLHRELHVPIGIFNASWGSTMIETWISYEGFENDETLKEITAGMPQLNSEELLKVKATTLKNKVEKLQGPMLPTAAEAAHWKISDYSDSGWATIKLPGYWEEQGLEDLDGNIWLRKSFVLTASQAAQPAVLQLAMIDDNDITYINGQKVGTTNGYNKNRKYNIKAGILKEGNNVIAIKVNDSGGNGGIYGEAADVNILTGDATLPLSGEWLFRIESVSKVTLSLFPNSYPTLLYNAMIHPLIPYAIKGAIWYQGEANAGRAYQYRKTFPLLIKDWRMQWGQGNFPFYFVQLASWKADNGNSAKGSTWAELREAQAMTLSVPNTGMAVTTDIGETNDIHPKNKQDVGMRLALIALNKTYNKKNVYSGPTYLSHKIEGDKIIVSFTNTGSGLMVKDANGYLKGFEIAGVDKIFHYAKATIDGNKIIVSQASVTAPVAVRFSWADDAGESNLFNKEGLPATPFRTDNWKGITDEVKYQLGE